MQVPPVCREDSLEQEIATHSGILAWRISWIEEPNGLYIVLGVTKSWTRLKQLSMQGTSWRCSGRNSYYRLDRPGARCLRGMERLGTQEPSAVSPCDCF